jgi:hypothetical protein
VSWFARFRKPRLVPIAELADRAVAETAWVRLEEAGIPATVESDPAMLGGPVVTRVFVEAPNVPAAQRLVADLVVDGGAGNGD